jgi:hypothetical protein
MEGASQLRFENDDQVGIIFISKEDSMKLAAAIYNFCLENNINAKFDLKDKQKPEAL